MKIIGSCIEVELPANKTCGALSVTADGEEAPASGSEPARTYEISSNSLIQNLTYAISPSKTSRDDNNSPLDDEDAGDDTEDDVSLSAPNCHGDGMNEIKEIPKDSETSASTEFVTAAETVNRSPDVSSKGESFSLTTASLKLPGDTVRTSRCKSPVMQSHMARIMGCKASFIPKVQTHSARVQTGSHVKESCTQSETIQRGQMSIQTDQELSAAVAQTSRTSMKDEETEFPEQAPKAMDGNKTPISGLQRKSGYAPATVVEKKLSWNAKPKVGSLENSRHKPGGGATSIPVQRLKFKEMALPRVDSITDYRPAGGQLRIVTRPANFKSAAKSKIRSLDNVSHKPQGGDKKIYQAKLTFKQTATSRIDSFTNVNHQPGGGNQKIFYQVVARRTETQSFLCSGHDKLSKPRRKVRDGSPRSTASDSSEIGYSVMTEPIGCSTPSLHQQNHSRSRKIITTQSVYF